MCVVVSPRSILCLIGLLLNIKYFVVLDNLYLYYLYRALERGSTGRGMGPTVCDIKEYMNNKMTIYYIEIRG